MEIYKDPSRPVSERIEDLLSRMTLEEKCAQLCGDLPMEIAQSENPEEVLRRKYPYGHGRFTQYSTTGLVDPAKIAELTNIIQHYFVEETRLGIPVALQSENLCGYPARGGTLFPSQTNVGCTWEPELAEKMAKIIGQESRAVGINSAMSPVIDVSRDPRWGRTYETYGEDPYLISQMGIHYIRGMQDDKKGPACVAKHFLGYAESQGGLNTAVSRINDRELYEVFATPFEAAMREADVSSVMANYGEIDGLNIVANKKIATDLLRKDMQFEGILTSDGAGIYKTYADYHTADTYEEAGYLAKKAGTDTEIPVGGSFSQLPKYVRAGILDEKCIDDSVRRVLKVKFEYGLFEHPYVDENAVKVSMSSPEKNQVSKEIAEKSLVLLTNDGTLPLKKGTRIALVGPHADSLRYPVSGYTYPAYIEMFENAAKGNGIAMNGMADEEAKAKKEQKEKKTQSGFAQMLNSDIGSLLPGMKDVLREMGATTLREELSKRFTVSYAEGCGVTDPDESGIPAAVKTAEDADVIVMACGGTSGWVNVTGGEGIDRCRLTLPGVQQELLDKMLETGKPVVLILYGPQIFSLPEAKERCAAMVQAYMPGQFAGAAVADLLDGTLNPGGKMVVSVPRSVGQIPVTYNHRTVSGYSAAGTSKAASVFKGGYVDEDCHPLFYFGHGLSYTTFKLEDFQLSATEIPTDGKLIVSLRVTNTGDRDGSETVQLYYHTKKAHVIRPNMQLAGFVRVYLKAGESKKVTFLLDTAQLGYYNEDMEFVVEPTVMDVMVGTSAEHMEYKAEVQLIGEKRNVMHKRVYTCQAEVQ